MYWATVNKDEIRWVTGPILVHKRHSGNICHCVITSDAHLPSRASQEGYHSLDITFFSCFQTQFICVTSSTDFSGFLDLSLPQFPPALFPLMPLFLLPAQVSFLYTHSFLLFPIPHFLPAALFDTPSTAEIIAVLYQEN
jgi:hypothetical protein